MAEPRNNGNGIDNTYRRKWNRNEYVERARERQEEDQRKSSNDVPPLQRKPLRHRDYEVDLNSRLGQTQIVTPAAPLSQQAGYLCNVCDCVVKDSATYLEHINGKKHQRALGMSMRVERASLQQVQHLFFHAQKKHKSGCGSFSVQDLDESILKQEQDEEERKLHRRERKKEKKKQKAAEERVDDEVAAMMGFGGFGSSKK